MHKIIERTFSAELVREGSFGTTDLGRHQSTMTLYDDRGEFFIEWDIPSLEETETIGVVFENKVLVDYDGVCSLSREAIELLRKASYTVPADME